VCSSDLDGVSPISAFTLIQQQEPMRKLLKCHGTHASIAHATPH
jgi:hypothetical protein